MSQNMAGRNRRSISKLVRLPEKRVRSLMKSSPEVENIGKDALFLVNKATELFIQYLTQSAYSISIVEDELRYNDIAEIVQTQDMMSFLREIMPKQITFGEYKKMMAAKGIPIIYESVEEQKARLSGASDQNVQNNVEYMEQDEELEEEQTVINDCNKKKG